MNIIYELVLEPDHQSNENYLDEYPDDQEAQAEFQEQFEAGLVGFVLIYTRVTIKGFVYESDVCGGCIVPFKDGKPAPECFELGSDTNAFIVDIAQENYAPSLTTIDIFDKDVAKFPIVLEGF